MDQGLRQHHDALLRDFDAVAPDIAVLRDTLHDHMLTPLALELVLSETDIAWLSEWLSDTGSIFRLFRHHKYIRPFTLQQFHSIAIWRLRVLRPALSLPLPTLFHCLPPQITDPFGRPIVFLKLTSFQSLLCPFEDTLLQEVERLRLHLRYIHDNHPNSGSFPLQYIVLVDLDGVAVQRYYKNLSLCSWVFSEVIPRYPGMFAAVFVLNYSWIHSGAWSFAKRILPSSLIARVLFPSKARVVDYFSAANLPEEYGGSLPTLNQIDDPLRSLYQAHHFPCLPTLPNLANPSPSPHQIPCVKDLPPTSALTDLSPEHAPSTIALAPMSPRNPFFGYPAIASTSSPHTIRHVQKGWHKLVRTLAVLWWRRWSRWVWTWMGVCAVLLAFALRVRRAKLKGLALVPTRR